MRKLILLLFLLTSFIVLNSLHLENFYHKNYNFVHRIVFVFDDYPGYTIEKSRNTIKLTINRSSFAHDINELPIEENPVISAFSFLDSYDNLKINIELNRDEDETRDFGMDDFILKGDVYKLVLDVMKYEVPANDEEFNNIIEFYKFVGMQEKTTYYENMLADFNLLDQGSDEEIEAEEIPETVIEEENQVIESQEPVLEKQDKKPSKFVEMFNSIFNNTNFSYILILILIAIVIILGIFLLIIRKQSKRNDIFHEEEQLGSFNFRVKVIALLKEAGWEDQAIAEELGISIEEVKKNNP